MQNSFHFDEIFSKEIFGKLKYFLHFFIGWKQFQIMIGARHEEVITVQEIIKGKPFQD